MDYTYLVNLTLRFLPFPNSVKSERELMRVVPERRDYHRFIGYRLDAEIPNHSLLPKARTHRDREILDRFFVSPAGQCAAFGLIGGKAFGIQDHLITAVQNIRKIGRHVPDNQNVAEISILGGIRRNVTASPVPLQPGCADIVASDLGRPTPVLS